MLIIAIMLIVIVDSSSWPSAPSGASRPAPRRGLGGRGSVPACFVLFCCCFLADSLIWAHRGDSALADEGIASRELVHFPYGLYQPVLSDSSHTGAGCQEGR